MLLMSADTTDAAVPRAAMRRASCRTRQTWKTVLSAPGPDGDDDRDIMERRLYDYSAQQELRKEIKATVLSKDAGN